MKNYAEEKPIFKRIATNVDFELQFNQQNNLFKSRLVSLVANLDFLLLEYTNLRFINL